MNNRDRFILATGLVVGLLMGIAGFRGANPGAWAQDDGNHASAENAVELVGPGVVTVLAYSQNADSVVELTGSGSGFIIDGEGHIVTNNHVVATSVQFDVVFADGRLAPAVLVGVGPIGDIAVLKVDGEMPAVLAWGDSNLLRTGQTVIALGSPGGRYSNTATHGIVSTIGRDEPAATRLINMIQHDASINPGNSGSPLLNLSGEGSESTRLLRRRTTIPRCWPRASRSPHPRMSLGQSWTN